MRIWFEPNVLQLPAMTTLRTPRMAPPAAFVAVEETIVRRATAVEETIVRRATALEAEIGKDIVLPLRDTAARFGGYAHFLAYSSESFFSSPERGPFGPIPLDRCSSRLTISEAKSLSLAIAYLWGAS